jgi:hypothetical protein
MEPGVFEDGVDGKSGAGNRRVLASEGGMTDAVAPFSIPGADQNPNSARSGKPFEYSAPVCLPILNHFRVLVSVRDRTAIKVVHEIVCKLHLTTFKPSESKNSTMTRVMTLRRFKHMSSF